jgi:hypothetical protein
MTGVILTRIDNRKIIILCHFYQIIAFVPGYTILFPMVYRICMFCFFNGFDFSYGELINDFFSEQSNLDDSNSTVPEPIDPLYDKLTQLHITETDVEDVLQLLDKIVTY